MNLSRRSVCPIAVHFQFGIHLPASAKPWIVVFSLLGLWFGGGSPAVAQPPLAPKIAPASDEAEQAIQRFRIPESFAVQLFAAEPDVANPVAFFVDSSGRVFVCESFRQEAGIEDNREHPEWLLDDLAAQTVEDRLSYIRKHLGDRATEYSLHDDRIRLLEDTNNDGRADQSKVFADGFNGIVDGTGAGVLYYKGNVYYSCIPHLWLLQDVNQDGQADKRESLHHGFGVRFAFRGHDMHGLIVGYDRRLYFSIGDRGYRVSDSIKDPGSGAVFRCELDGSQLEVIATGLRNPQELAFDKFGNLFTGDNNSDSGDRARWVYIAEGGDSGWRMEYQYLPDRGPFNREKIWHPYHEETPAFIVPPVANLSDGPSGLAFYPGTGLSDDFEDCFFLCDFRGQSENSGIRTISLANKGAFFEVTRNEETFWQFLPTDVMFGPDGKIYFSDWVHGWVGEGKGRIYTLTDKVHGHSRMAREVQQLLSQGFEEFSNAELFGFLNHRDQRIRQRAQFELSDRDCVNELIDFVVSDVPRLARIHALWAVEYKARRGQADGSRVLDKLKSLTTDRDAEIRAQFARACGDMESDSAIDTCLLQWLADSNDRVKYFSALSLGKRKCVAAADPLFQMLTRNAGRDPMLQHAGIMALFWIGDEQVLNRAIVHPSASVRLATVVALRKLGSSDVAKMLNDAEDRVVIEAARAIYDVRDAGRLFEPLAAAIDRAACSPHLVRRVMAANLYLGGEENARRIAAMAADQQLPPELRLIALDLIETWSQPRDTDPVLGMWRPLSAGDADIARGALLDHLNRLLAGDPQIAARALQIAAKLNIQQVGPILVETFRNQTDSPGDRANALVGLANMNTEGVNDLIEDGLSDPSAQVRSVSTRLLSKSDPGRAAQWLATAIQSRNIFERQSAFQTMATMTDPETAKMLVTAVSRLNEIPSGTQLDVLAAAGARSEPSVRQALELYERQSNADPFSKYKVCLHGGDPHRGKEIFYALTSASCLRCHQIGGIGGRVGPDLSDIGAKKDRSYLLNSLVQPNLDIAKGFETMVVLDTDGVTHTGIRLEEDSQRLTLMTADGNAIFIPLDSIDDIRHGQSSMPDDISGTLSMHQIRDLVEFLSLQK